MSPYIEQQHHKAFLRRIERNREHLREHKLHAPWKQYRDLHGDPLAFRALILRREGWQTLHNIIFGAHDLPNRY